MNKKNISEMIFALSGELPGTAVVINQFIPTTELISEFFQWIADNDLPHGVVVGSAKEFGTGRVVATRLDTAPEWVLRKFLKTLL